MKWTINLPEELTMEAKILAIREKKTLQDLVQAALELYIGRAKPKARPAPGRGAKE